jgi:hypothetical protein
MHTQRVVYNEGAFFFSKLVEILAYNNLCTKGPENEVTEEERGRSNEKKFSGGELVKPAMPATGKKVGQHGFLPEVRTPTTEIEMASWSSWRGRRRPHRSTKFISFLTPCTITCCISVFFA